LNQSWIIPSAVFVKAVALQNKFPLSSKFEKSWERAKDIQNTCFVDLGKAYDRFPCEKLWMVLWEYGVDGCLFAGSRVTVFLLKRLCPCWRS